MIEAAREFAHQLEVRYLILADRHHVGAIDQDVGALHHRVAEKAVSRQIPVGELFLLVLVGRHALQPADRRDHAEQQRELGVLGHARLDEHRCARSGLMPTASQSTNISQTLSSIVSGVS